MSDEREVTDWDTTEAMIVYGGAFLSRLGRLWRVADESNRAILETAFKDYFDRYRELAELQKSRSR
jgi:hypothetical protein